MERIKNEIVKLSKLYFWYMKIAFLGGLAYVLFALVFQVSSEFYNSNNSFSIQLILFVVSIGLILLIHLIVEARLESRLFYKNSVKEKHEELLLKHRFDEINFITRIGSNLTDDDKFKSTEVMQVKLMFLDSRDVEIICMFSKDSVGKDLTLQDFFNEKKFQEMLEMTILIKPIRSIFSDRRVLTLSERLDAINSAGDKIEPKLLPLVSQLNDDFTAYLLLKGDDEAQMSHYRKVSSVENKDIELKGESLDPNSIISSSKKDNKYK
jgi:hypothetical protein